MKRTLSQKLKKSVSAILAAAMSLSLFTAIPVSADIGRTTYNYDGYSVDYNVTNEWDGAQTVELTVSNTGTDSILNWALKYDAEGEISNLWNADLYEQNGDEYVIKNVGWNFEIAPDQSVTYGYTLSDNDLTLPKSFEIYSKRVDKEEGYDVQYNITKSWDTGVEGNIVITNTSTAPIEAWTLSFDSNFTIDNFWNSRVIENNELSYTISNQMATSAIQPNTSFTVGFTGTKMDHIEALLNNFKLTEVVIGDGNSVIPLDPSADKTGITANATYIYESGNIIVSWNTNNPKGTFNILMSEDGNNFTSIGVVEDMYEYVYIPNSTFNKIYFKVKQTTEDNSIESNIAAVYSFNSDGEKFPYTLFAVSDKDGAITINSDNFCINGDVSTNGTIVSNNNIININGAKIEKANNDMLYVFDKIEALYFSDNNVDEYSNDYILNDMNININTPMSIMGKTFVTGSININTALKAYEDIELYGDVKNTNNCLIFSKYRDITIDSTNVNLSGLIYAPFGNVQITAQNLNLNDVVIIANTITLNSPNINTNYGDKTAQLIGNTSDPLDIPYDEWKYMKDENENGFPDFFEDMNNWSKLKDTDGDKLPDPVEIFLGSDINIADTDGDMLPDGYEVLTSLTNPIIFDSYEQGISDGECDIDNDGLSNYQEYTLGTNPYNNDSDNDGLKDGEEINTYNTDPLNPDSDADGISDGDEIILNTNPLDFNENNKNSFTKTFTPDMFGIHYTEYYPEIILTSDSKGILSFDMSVYINDIDYNCNVPGYIDYAFDFTTDSEFESAILKFHIPSNLLHEQDFEPAIYYYNKDEKRLEEVANQSVNGNVLTTKLEHFSVYTVLNKRAFNAKYNESDQYYQYLPLDDDELNDNTAEADIIFVLDDSGSMEWNDRNNGRKSATSLFIQQLPETDKIGLIKFTTSASTLYNLSYATEVAKTSFSNNLSRLYNNGGTDGTTGLNLAINQLNNDNRAKCIIFLTDGVDTTNRYSYSNLIKRANENGITIFTIGLGDDVNSSLLNDIATSTYGKYFSISDTSELFNCFLEIKELVIDYIVDSNNDGISDYDTWKLCSGQYLNGTGQRIFPFGFPTEGDTFKECVIDLYKKVQLNDDFDGDGLKNGEEVSITSYGSHKFIYMKSSPIDSDSDFDGFSDYDELKVYGTNPMDFTLMVNENQLNHLTRNDDYIASQYKNQVLGGDVFNNLAIWLGNNVYSLKSKNSLYLSELTKLLAGMEEGARREPNDKELLTQFILFAPGAIGACIDIKKLYDPFDMNTYKQYQYLYYAIEDMKYNVKHCNSSQIEQYLKDFSKSQLHVDLGKTVSIKSSIVMGVNSKCGFWGGVDMSFKVISSFSDGYETYCVYEDLQNTAIIFEESIGIFNEIKNTTNDSELILAISNALPIMGNEYKDYMNNFAEASKAFGISLLYNDIHFAIGAAGPVGAAIELGLGIGNLTGIPKGSEYAVRTCCAASFADGVSNIWSSTVRNNPSAYDKYGNINWYAEKGLSTVYVMPQKIINYFEYVLNTRTQANNDFIELQNAGIAAIMHKYEKETAEINKQWLERDYLEKNNLYLTI